MSSAQTGLSVSDPQAYRERLFTLIAGRDPLEVMGETAAKLAEIVASHSLPVLRSRPFPGKWTPNEIIGHLADTEWVYGYRQRMILSEENPPISGTKQDLWVSALHYNQCEPTQLVKEFRTLREFNLALWRRSSPEELKRVGQHNERGTESLAVIVRMIAGHDLSHLQQIRRYIEAVQQSA